VETPAWWVDVLYKRLSGRLDELELFDAYYRGDHPLPWLAPQARNEFRRILRMTRSNYMALPVNAKAQRMGVDGFRVSNPDGDFSDAPSDELRRIWEFNELDLYSDLAWIEALIAGSSYMLVAPNPDAPALPFITIEHPSQVVVAYEPGSNRRRARAALKVWVDEWTGAYLATLYLPDRLWKMRAEGPKRGEGSYTPLWKPRVEGMESEPNPLGEVPFREITLTPRLLSGGRPFLTDVIDIQDRINKTLADRLLTQDFGAFPQKWASGWPDEDADGNPTDPIQVGRDRMLTTDATETKFGQFTAADMDPYSNAKREDVKDIASITCTPIRSLLGEISNVNGETLKASENDHIAMVKQMCRYAGAGIEGVARLTQKAAGLPVSEMVETIWANPEYRTEGELTDAVVKRVQTGLSSIRQGREDLGYSAAQIKRLEQDDREAAANQGVDATLQRVLRPVTANASAANPS
jgi:hypothetical protein